MMKHLLIFFANSFYLSTKIKKIYIKNNYLFYLPFKYLNYSVWSISFIEIILTNFSPGVFYHFLIEN